MRSAIVGLALVCATVAGAAEESAPMVQAVELHLPRGVDPTGISDAIVVTRGQPLSKAAVRRSIERLYFTQRFSDIVVRQEQSEGGVRVIFDLTPKLFIAELHVDGEKAVQEKDILAVARLRDDRSDQKAEYFPEALSLAKERVLSLYHRRGYRQAKVEAEAREGDAGVMVLLTIEEGAPTTVSAVTFGGNPGLPLTKLIDTLAVSPGTVLDLDRLERGVERVKTLYRQERFFRARVGDPEILETERGTMLALPVTAGPQYDFHFRGNSSFPDKLLRGILSYDGSESLDRVVMGRMARRIANLYRYHGFHQVKVESDEVRAPNHARAIVAFRIVEGPQLYVREVNFEGNKAISTLMLRRILADQIAGLTPVPNAEVSAQDDPLEIEGRLKGGARPQATRPDPLTVFVPEAYEEATRAMREVYRERGYLSANVAVPEVQIDVARNTAQVQVRVEEGPQAIVRRVKYVGLPAGYDPSKSNALREGEPFRFSGIDETTRALTRSLGRAGYLFARIEGESSLSADGKDALVAYRVEPGPRVRVGQVVISGLAKTEEDLVRANLVVREGAVMDPEALFDSQRNLVLLGVFRNVAVRLRDPDSEEAVKDVLVEVRERPRLSGEISGGYSLVDGPRIVGDATYPNLWGSATSLSGRLKLNYIGASALVVSGDIESPEGVLDGIDFRGNLALAQPRIFAFLPARVGTRLDLIGERVHRPAYDFLRYAAVAGADWAALDWLTLSLQYEIEHDRVRLSDRANSLIFGFGRSDLERARLGNGDFSLHSVRPAVTFDFRDDFARPTRGFLFSGTAELTNDLGAKEILPGGLEDDFKIQSLKLAGTLTGYVPVAPRVVLAVSARGGKIFHLHEESRTIAPKRFFLGGAGSMRGFPEDGVIAEDRRSSLRDDLNACKSLVLPMGCSPESKWLASGNEVPSDGGELFTLLKSELRFPVYGSFDLGVFVEAGNLWLKGDNFDPLKLRYVAGTGVRYGTPIGPIALDVGVNLLPDEALNERRANLHFSIGLF